MFLVATAMVYPRIELPYLKTWLDYQFAQGVSRVFITLHINSVRKRELTKAEIIWTKKPDIPYIYSGTEDEILSQTMRVLQPYVDAGRLEVTTSKRIACADPTAHRPAQRKAYAWALSRTRRIYPKGAWILACDIDEFVVACDQKLRMVDAVRQEVAASADTGVLICRCIIHPSRYDHNELPWDTYVPHGGLNLAICKSVTYSRAATRIDIHKGWVSKKAARCNRRVSRMLYVHHFRGFDSYVRMGGGIMQGWPTEAHRQYVTKDPSEWFAIGDPPNITPLK